MQRAWLRIVREGDWQIIRVLGLCYSEVSFPRVSAEVPGRVRRGDGDRAVEEGWQRPGDAQTAERQPGRGSRPVPAVLVTRPRER